MGDFGDFAKRLKKGVKDMEKTIDKEMADESVSMGNTAKRNLIKQNSVTSSDPLVTKIYTRKLQHPVHFTAYTVVAPEKYAKFLEKGTGFRGGGNYKAPSSPPTTAIYAWILSKGIKPRTEGIDSQWQLAIAIATTIETYGTRPHPFMVPAMRTHRPSYKKSVSNAMSTALRRM